MTDVWDVAVVGAGPAGSVAAREMARRGLRVLLLDKATFPRSKVCGCCLNGAALGTLRAIGLDNVPVRCGAVPLSGVRLAAGGRTADVRLPGGVALSRESFDAALVAEAVAAGATFRPATAVRLGEIRDHGRGLHLISSQHTEARAIANVVVAADGLNGHLTVTEGNRTAVDRTSRIGAGVVTQDAPAFYQPGTIFMAVGRGGYVGLVRLEDDRLDVAAAFDASFVRAAGGPGPAAAGVLREAGYPAIPDLAALPWRGTPPLTRQSIRVAGPRWFAIGDATGYVEPFTGEGMAWAIASASAIAPLAARGVLAWTDALTEEWEAAHARIVRSRQGTCRIIARVLRSPRLSRLAVWALSMAPGLSRPVVGVLNRPSPVPRLAPDTAA